MMLSRISKNLQKFKLITFDVTDTLLSFKERPGIVYAKTAQQFGYKNIDADRLAESFRGHFKYMSTKYPNFGRNEISWENWWRMLIANILRAAEPTIPEKATRQIADYLIDKYETDECWLKHPKANELIDAIKGAKKTVGIISNFDPRLKFLVENTGLPMFDFILASYEVGDAKPSPKIFDLALKYYPGKIDMNEALHIGNTPKLDYMAAKEAGWHAVLIANNTQDWLQYKSEIHSDHVYKNLDDFYFKLVNTDIKW